MYQCSESESERERDKFRLSLKSESLAVQELGSKSQHISHLDLPAVRANIFRTDAIVLHLYLGNDVFGGV